MLNIINGKEVEASDKSTINIVNPFTGRKIDTVPNSTSKDVKKAVNGSINLANEVKANDLKARLIVIPTLTGYSAKLVSNFSFHDAD